MSIQIVTRDQDGEIRLGFSELMLYCGPANIIAAALTLRVAQAAFSLISPHEPPMRRELTWQLGFLGAGILDCVEMISLAVREGRCLCNPAMHVENAPKAQTGHFIFMVGYREKTALIIPKGSIFDDEFREKVNLWQHAEDSAGRRDYLEWKRQKAMTILGLEPENLFETLKLISLP